MRSLITPAFRTLRVFVCHASEDKAAVARLCDQLSAEGIDCWFDIRSLVPGANWEQEIQKTIRRSDSALVCLSKRVKSKKTFLQTEIRLVLDAAAAQSHPSSFVFPVLLEACDLPRKLRKWQAVNVTKRKGLHALLAAFRAVSAGLPGVAAPGDSSAERDWEPPRVRRKLRDIIQSTRDYERWLRKLTPVVEADFQLKHREMSLSALAFFRATFYRWTEVWPAECPDLAQAPLVLSAGEVNIDAFGTWLDPEGRVAWGLTVLDEAYPLPYTSDLARLAASWLIAAQADRFAPTIRLNRICRLMVESYADTLARGGSPYVLGAKHAWLYSLCRARQRDPQLFWERLQRLPKAANVPREVREALERSLPLDAPFQILAQVSGLGSLGRPKYVGIAEWMGGPVAARARYIPVPAGAWAAGHESNVRTYHNTVLETARRTPNLRSGVWKGLFVARIGPDIARVEAATLARKKDLTRLMRACATEVANVHLGTPGAGARIVEHLRGLPESWLADAAKAMAKRNRTDWEGWRASR
jgi:TIR domain-containing protein/uncharacterized protein DUF2252